MSFVKSYFDSSEPLFTPGEPRVDSWKQDDFLENEIKFEQMRVEYLKQIEDLQREITQLTKKILAFRYEIRDLKKENDTIKTHNLELKQSNVGLQSYLCHFVEKNSKLKEENRALHAIISSLNAEVKISK